MTPANNDQEPPPAGQQPGGTSHPQDGAQDARRIAFVCTANMIRSPFAAAYFNQHIAPNLQQPWIAVSAGVRAKEGQPVLDSAKRAAQVYEINLNDHSSSPITPEFLDEVDEVMCMEVEHADTIRELAPWAEEKVSLLGAWLRPAVLHIDDPVGQGDDAHDQVFAQIVEALRLWVEEEGKSTRHDT